MVSKKEKQAARNKLWNAIWHQGFPRGEECELCSFMPIDRGLIHAHHEDYSKPLEVRWFCASCHTRHHLGLPIIGHPRRNHPKADRRASQQAAA